MTRIPDSGAVHRVSAERIDALLPQTQCTRCGYNGCRPYAEAIADGEAEINQCPPGGQQGVVKLAELLGRKPLPLNPANGVEQALTVALIDESLCIGCTLCIQACPVDAIVGAARRMHTVLPQACTGCDLCVAPCPMDCIVMKPVAPRRDWTQDDADRSRSRMLSRKARLAREKLENDERLAARALAKIDALDASDDLSREQIAQKKAIVAAAVERAKARRSAALAPPAAPVSQATAVTGRAGAAEADEDLGSGAST